MHAKIEDKQASKTKWERVNVPVGARKAAKAPFST
jgi:hypothetical protein